MDLRLSGKTALVCASSRGLGFASAKQLAAEGCDIFLCARSEQELQAAAIAIEAPSGVKVFYKAIDLSSPGGGSTLLSEAKKKLGRVDILINNVGGPSPSSAAATTAEAWRSGFDQLFLSAVTLSQAVVPEMIKNKFGRIITITSLSVVEPIDHLAVSTAMRLAVTGFSKTLASEVAEHGITVNTVMPGVIHTKRIENLRSAKAERDGTTLALEMDKTAKTIPAKRLGTPEELAALVAFLASPLASYITGANIPVDGGLRKAWN
jgi:3-oxoacyl-[acyl-carrier protein] reductase